MIDVVVSVLTYIIDSHKVNMGNCDLSAVLPYHYNSCILMQ